VPYPALLETGKFYLRQQGRSAGIPVRDILQTAVQSLGLMDTGKFNIEERVLGLPEDWKQPLVRRTVFDFSDEVSRESPAPGGGSIAALAGALGAALASMVSNLTANRRGSERVDAILNGAAEQAQEIKERMIRAVDADTNAFNSYMAARRLPSKTAEEKAIRKAAEQEGLKQAVAIPLETARLSLQAMELCQTVAEHGNPNSITDVGVGAQMAFSGVKGGVYNVLINLKDITDPDFNAEMRQACEALLQSAGATLISMESRLDKALGRI